MENNERVLTEKQQAVWDLKQQGMPKTKIAETLGISLNMVTTHLKNTERRFREYERYLANEEKNNQVVDIDLTLGELELIVHAINEYQHILMKKAHFNVNTDWRGRLPYDADKTQKISAKIQNKIYGRVLYESVLGTKKEDSDTEN